MTVANGTSTAPGEDDNGDLAARLAAAESEIATLRQQLEAAQRRRGLVPHDVPVPGGAAAQVSAPRAVGEAGFYLFQPAGENCSVCLTPQTGTIIPVAAALAEAAIDDPDQAGQVDRESFGDELAPELLDVLEAAGFDDADLHDARLIADTLYCLGYTRAASATPTDVSSADPGATAVTPANLPADTEGPAPVARTAAGDSGRF